MNRSTFYEYFNDLPDLLGQAENDMIAAFMTSAYVGVLTYWDEHGRKDDLTDLAKQMQVLALSGIEGINW